ncbi:hypothetical protein RHGRI_014123 [Rhododendron griersonianum]|uniref:DNA topoisomerase (ATP-hydrolyzing) n=1 Tax=Rhododendron griersonianum TaxID=479676 RepID=A0AAV6K8R4_9ERIC|nr:hypothetical protein RHGRI_014123 [Rhododendron griersonianum]
MENREKKTLTGFCYWGGERKVNANGTFLYNGGMCVAVLLEEGSQVNELLEKVCGALHINLEDACWGKLKMAAENKEYFNDLESHRKDIIWEDKQDGEAFELAFSKKKIEAKKELAPTHLGWTLYNPGTYLDQKEKLIKYSDLSTRSLFCFQWQIFSGQYLDYKWYVHIQWTYYDLNQIPVPQG